MTAFGQLHSFGSAAKPVPATRYKFNLYGYYDIFKEAGFGLQYQIDPLFSLDGAAFYIRPNPLTKGIDDNDLAFFKGGGASLTFKYHFSRHSKFYVGLCLSLQYLEHDPAYSPHKGTYITTHDLDACYGYGSGKGIVAGAKLAVKQLRLEPYVLLGVINTSLQRTTYGSLEPSAVAVTYPRSIYEDGKYLNASIGIKIGFAFKKNKRQEAIDRKFDELYLQKYAQLKEQIDAIPTERLKASRSLKIAKSALRTTNKRFLKIYRRNYYDTIALYRDIDKYFQAINPLIIAK